MKITDEQKRTFWEFVRYCVVGGTAFLAETLTHFLLWKFVLHTETGVNTAIATATGFVVGLIVNYVLSILWVFTGTNQKKQGKTLKAFLIFTAVGLIGLLLKELLMGLGALISGHSLADFGQYTIPYYASHIISAGIVTVWNYLGRKILVFRKR